MAAYIHRIETVVPETYYEQAFASSLMQRNVDGRDAIKRILRSIYHNSGIRKRHSVIRDFAGTNDTPLFFDGNGNKSAPPDTRMRNEVYTKEARKLFVSLAEKLIRNTPGFDKHDITHIVTVSCTGFFAPGPDYFVVRDLGLSGDIERYHIGFMGCYAAFQGLKMARSFCTSHPDAVVLVLCVELCTLHLQFSDDTDSMISASVFADGGSGALVSARKPVLKTLEPDNFEPDNFEPDNFEPDNLFKNKIDKNNLEPSALSNHAGNQAPLAFGSVHSPVDQNSKYAASTGVSRKAEPAPFAPMEILSLQNALTDEGEKDMAWTIGNEGFLMKLSTYVPDIIRCNIRPVLDTILNNAGISINDIRHWAVHPGGRAILDKVQEALSLPEQQLAASRYILREYGNMSSATILFVLRELSDQHLIKRNHQMQQISEHPAAEQFASEGHEHNTDTGEILFAMAFGPGLTIESGLLRFSENP